MNEQKDRKPSGPRPVLQGRRTINVSLTDDLIEYAREVGKGNISKGLRETIDTHKMLEKNN